MRRILFLVYFGIAWQSVLANVVPHQDAEEEELLFYSLDSEAAENNLTLRLNILEKQLEEVTDQLKRLSSQYDSLIERLVPAENALNVEEFPPEDALNFEEFPAEDALNVKEFPDQDALNVEEFPAEDASNVEEFPEEDALNFEEFSAEDSLNVEEIPAEDALNVKEFPEEDASNVEEFPAEDALSFEEFPAEDIFNVEDFLQEFNENDWGLHIQKVFFSKFQMIGEKLYYIENKEKLDWYQASAKCIEKNAHLVNLKNEEEWNAIRSYLDPFESYWINIRESNYEGNFVSETSPNEPPFLMWYDSEPNNLPTSLDNEACVELRSQYNHFMNDISCYDQNYFICEA